VWAALAASVESAVWAVSGVLAASAELEEWVASEAGVVLGVRVESAGATGHRSGSTTRSTVAERLMEIGPRPIGSAA